MAEYIEKLLGCMHPEVSLVPELPTLKTGGGLLECECLEFLIDLIEVFAPRPKAGCRGGPLGTLLRGRAERRARNCAHSVKTAAGLLHASCV